MYARDPAVIVESGDAKQESALSEAVITVVWAVTLTLTLFAFLGAVALLVI